MTTIEELQGPTEYREASLNFRMIWLEYLDREKEAKDEIIFMFKILVDEGYSRTEAIQKIKDWKIKDSLRFNKLLSFDTSFTLGGKPAYKIVYENWTYSKFNDQVSYPQYIHVGTITEGIEYNLRFYAHNANLFNQYVPIADKIINSFEFIQ
jgi:hypothetical protein